jgi:hypothetical protein
VYVCPASLLPEDLREILRTRLQKILPGDIDVDLSLDTKEMMDKEFDKLYKSASGDVTHPEKYELTEIVTKLSSSETTEMLEYVRQLIGKRSVPEDDEHGDSSGQDDDEHGDSSNHEDDETSVASASASMNQGGKRGEQEAVAGCSGASGGAASDATVEKRHKFTLRSKK